MTSVREQTPLASEGRVEPGEQLVERVAERFDLVARRRHREPLRRVVLGDPRCAGSHALDRPQRGTGHLVARVAREKQAKGSRDDQQLPQSLERLVPACERIAYGHGDPRAAAQA